MTDIPGLAAELTNDPLGWGYNGPGIINPGPSAMSNAEAAVQISLLPGFDPQALRPLTSPVAMTVMKEYLSEESFDNGVNTKFLFEFARDLANGISPLGPTLAWEELESGKFIIAMAKGLLGDPPAVGNPITPVSAIANYDAACDGLATAGGCSNDQRDYLKSPAVKEAGGILNAFQQYIGQERHNNGVKSKVIGSFAADMKMNLSPLAPEPGPNQVQAGAFIANLYVGYQDETLWNFDTATWAQIVDRFEIAGGCSPSQATDLKNLSSGLQSRADELILGLVREGEVEQARAL